MPRAAALLVCSMLVAACATNSRPPHVRVLKVTGKDEIADMSRAFNRMRRSIIKIVQMVRRMQSEAKAKGKAQPKT